MNPWTILVVDDEPLNLAVLSRLLKPHGRVLGARSGPSALGLLDSGVRPDLIMLDVMMPGMDGYEVLERLKASTAWRDIPVIFVTALHADVDEEHGLAMGAVDYITKPIKPAVVLARVRAQLELKQSRDRLSGQNAWLGRELARRMRESQLAQDLVLAAMAQLAETRDSTTGNHILRTQTYVELLGEAMQADPRHAAELQPLQLRRIVKAAPMHDIGKIGIPDHILLKADRLTAEEFEIMKGHAELGGRVIAEAMRTALAAAGGSGPAAHGDPEGNPYADRDGDRGWIAAEPDPAGPWALQDESLPLPLQELEVARVIALHHHERWDGLGYPAGLAGAAIPMPARLMAVADVFDALTTRRPYKAPWTLADATAYIQRHSGTHFDPDVVQSFVAQGDAFGAVAARLSD